MLLAWTQCVQLSHGFAVCSNLTTISVSSPPSGLTQLNTLYALLAGSPNLTSITVNTPSLTDAALAYLAPACPQLTSINLYSTSITDTGLAFLLASCPLLSSIDVSMTRITDAGMTILGQFQHLETLNISANRITDQGIQNFINGGNLQNLHSINFAKTNIGNAGMLALFQNAPSLTCMNYNFSLITYDGLQMLIDDPTIFPLTTIFLEVDF